MYGIARTETYAMEATTAFETLTDLIDANKDKMTDYDYMKMMDCMKTMFEKKNAVPIAPIVREPVRDFDRETLLTIRNQRLTQKFYEIYTAKHRCSNCGDTRHNSSLCFYEPAIINFEAGEDYGEFSISVLINKNYRLDLTPTHREVIDLVTHAWLGIVSNEERPDLSDYICKIIDGKYHYFNKRILKDLCLMDRSSSYYMKSGLQLSQTNHKNKYFDK